MLGPVPTDMLAEAEDYQPMAKSYRRLYQMGLMVDVPREKVAHEVVAAVGRKRRYVFLPRRSADVPVLAVIPRLVVEFLLTGIPHQATTPTMLNE
jgi:hypothetical protein